MNWSERLWKDRELVGKKVTEILETGIPQGKSMQEMSRELADTTGQQFNNAFRLIRTEAAHVDGEVLLDSFRQAQEELGLEYYILDAFLDNRTSDICRKIDEEMKRELSFIIPTLKDPRLDGCLISVVAVHVTKDMKFAKVYVSILGKDEEAIKGLNSSSGFVRREIGMRMKLRYTPEISFVADTSIAYGAHISEVIKDLNINSGEKDEEDN
jgi:ribosome-binding factor A